jgi:hypothetical protein
MTYQEKYYLDTLNEGARYSTICTILPAIAGKAIITSNRGSRRSPLSGQWLLIKPAQ